MTKAYYNELDPFAAAWLRELITAGHIAPGDVDDRSITDVRPSDLAGYTQCHFFAGIGVWSYALRCAGWRDTEPVWTGSCPCQPFSDAGAQAGFSDARHLWPVWFQLIAERNPLVVFGEQVASGLGLAWFDAVSSDLEGADYAVGAADLCAAGVGAPHVRQRLYFVADSERGRRQRGTRLRDCEPLGVGRDESTNHGGARELGYAVGARLEGFSRHGDDSDEPGRLDAFAARPTTAAGATGGMGDTEGGGRGEQRDASLARRGRYVDRAIIPDRTTAGHWRDAEWLACRDGKARAIEPGTFPLATRAPARVGRLRGYGNGLCAPQAQAFIEAYCDVRFPILSGRS